MEASTMKIAHLDRHTQPAKQRAGRRIASQGNASANGLGLSNESSRTFAAISDPKNADRFSVKAALQAFSHVKVIA
jgi:hypothetical protein